MLRSNDHYDSPSKGCLSSLAFHRLLRRADLEPVVRVNGSTIGITYVTTCIVKVAPFRVRITGYFENMVEVDTITDTLVNLFTARSMYTYNKIFYKNYMLGFFDESIIRLGKQNADHFDSLDLQLTWKSSRDYPYACRSVSQCSEDPRFVYFMDRKCDLRLIDMEELIKEPQNYAPKLILEAVYDFYLSPRSKEVLVITHGGHLQEVSSSRRCTSPQFTPGQVSDVPHVKLQGYARGSVLAVLDHSNFKLTSFNEKLKVVDIHVWNVLDTENKGQMVKMGAVTIHQIKKDFYGCLVANHYDFMTYLALFRGKFFTIKERIEVSSALLGFCAMDDGAIVFTDQTNFGYGKIKLKFK